MHTNFVQWDNNWLNNVTILSTKTYWDVSKITVAAFFILIHSNAQHFKTKRNYFCFFESVCTFFYSNSLWCDMHSIKFQSLHPKIMHFKTKKKFKKNWFAFSSDKNPIKLRFWTLSRYSFDTFSFNNEHRMNFFHFFPSCLCSPK